MRTFLDRLFWFALGSALAASVLVPVATWQAREKFDLGRYHGRLDGLGQAAQAIEREFGRHVGAGPLDVVFDIKDESVVALVVDGVRTVRVRH